MKVFVCSCFEVCCDWPTEFCVVEVYIWRTVYSFNICCFCGLFLRSLVSFSVSHGTVIFLCRPVFNLNTTSVVYHCTISRTQASSKHARFGGHEIRSSEQASPMRSRFTSELAAALIGLDASKVSQFIVICSGEIWEIEVILTIAIFVQFLLNAVVYLKLLLQGNVTFVNC